MSLLLSGGVTVPEFGDLECVEGGDVRDRLRERFDMIIAVSGLLCEASFRHRRYVIDPLGGAWCSRMMRRGRYRGPIFSAQA